MKLSAQMRKYARLPQVTCSAISVVPFLICTASAFAASAPLVAPTCSEVTGKYKFESSTSGGSFFLSQTARKNIKHVSLIYSGKQRQLDITYLDENNSPFERHTWQPADCNELGKILFSSGNIAGGEAGANYSGHYEVLLSASQDEALVIDLTEEYIHSVFGLFPHKEVTHTQYRYRKAP